VATEWSLETYEYQRVFFSFFYIKQWVIFSYLFLWNKFLSLFEVFDEFMKMMMKMRKEENEKMLN